MPQLIDGKAIAAQIKEEVKQEVANLRQQGREVCLAVVQVGDDAASSVYIKNKQKACEYVGITSQFYQLAEKTTEEELLSLVEKLNHDNKVNGILVQLPLPAHIDEGKIVLAISPERMQMDFIQRAWEDYVWEQKDLFHALQQELLSF